jgi:hypothetical protein
MSRSKRLEKHCLIGIGIGIAIAIEHRGSKADSDSRLRYRYRTLILFQRSRDFEARKPRWPPGSVELMLPPRQSRGISQHIRPGIPRLAQRHIFFGSRAEGAMECSSLL